MAVQIIIEKITSFFEYNTEKFVHIKNKKIGCSYRIIQLVIVLFIFVYVSSYRYETSTTATTVQELVYILNSEQESWPNTTSIIGCFNLRVVSKL